MKKLLFILIALMLFGTSTKAQWNQYLTGQESLIRDISVVNDNDIWIKDQNGVQFSITTDGGNSWVTKQFPADMTTNMPGGIYAISATTAYLTVSMGTNKGVYKTTNSGETWTRQTTMFNSANAFPDFVYFWNENEGVAVGDGYSNLNFEIYTTNNGGAQWNSVPSSSLPTAVSDYTYNSNSAFRVVGNSMYFTTNKGKIYKSNDKGLTWQMINTPLTNGDYMSFDFKDANNGLLVNSPSGSNTVLYSTVNGGLSWTIISKPYVYNNIKYIPNLNIYFSTHSIYGLSYSTDNGQTWTIHPSLKDAGLSTVAFNPSGKIFIGGWQYIYNSTNYAGINLSLLNVLPISSNKIDITFSQQVDNVTSQDTANYKVYYKLKPDTATKIYTYPIKVMSATLDDSNKALVHLITGTNFPIDTIQVNTINIFDLSGYSIINKSYNAFWWFIINSLNVSAGNLATLLNSTELSNISNLKITGTIDARDFVTMRDKMPKLAALDLSSANITAYSGIDGSGFSMVSGGPLKIKTLINETGDVPSNLTDCKTKQTVKSTLISYPANEIPVDAFYSYATTSGKRTLYNIVLPSTLTSIGNEAFLYTGLTSINFPQSLKRIGDWAFQGTLLSEVNLPPSVNELGEGSFFSTPNNTSFNVSSDNAFYSSADGVLFSKDKSSLIAFPLIKYSPNYTIPSTVKVIEYGAFYNTFWIGNVIFPSSLSAIKDYGFYGSSLSSLDLSGCNQLQTIGNYAFASTIISSLKLPASIISLGQYVFSNSNISTVDLSKNILLTSIPDYAFYNCTKLTSITLPDLVESLGFGFVIFSESLKDIFINANNPYFSLLDGVLYNKDNSNLLIYPPAKSKPGEYVIPSSINQIGDGAFTNSNFTSINAINSSITSIGRSAFNSSQISSFSFPKTLTEIVKLAFANCPNLLLFKIANPIPPTLGVTVFYNSNISNCTLDVPISSMSVYQAADQWKDFVNIVEDASALPSIFDESITIFPNPVNETLRIKGLKTRSIVKICDLNGNDLFTKFIFGDEFISVGWLTKGMYLMKIISSNGMAVRKIIKN